MKVTDYFKSIRSRPDRAIIKDEWIPTEMYAPSPLSTPVPELMFNELRLKELPQQIIKHGRQQSWRRLIRTLGH